MSNVFESLQLQRIAQAIEDGYAGATLTLDFTNVGDMTGATAGQAGLHGLVPAPAAGDQDKTLHGDGTWRDNDLPQVFGSGSGSTITITDAADYPANEFVIDIKLIQTGSGTPSPDNIRPISGWTEANITVSDGDLITNVYTIPFTEGSNTLTVYGGTLDVVSGTLTVDRKLLNTNDVNWSMYNGVFYIPSWIERTNTSIRPIAEQYITGSNANGMGTTSGWANQSIRQNMSGNSIYIKDTRFSNATDFKANANVNFVYSLANPIIYQLTQTEVYMLLGSCSISADAGDITTLKYVRSDYNDLMRAVPKMKMPDYSAVITSGTYNLYDGFNYTAIKDCMIYIMLGCSSSLSYPSVSVNNNSLGYIWSDTSGVEFPLFIPLKAGDVLDVSATNQGTNWTENYTVFALN